MSEVSYVPVVIHSHGGLRGCPLAYDTYRTCRHLRELWTTSWIHGPISCLSSWGDVLGHSSYWLASIPYYACARRSLASIGYSPSVYSYARCAYTASYVTPSMLPSMVMATMHLDSSGVWVRLCELVELWVSGWLVCGSSRGTTHL